MAWRSSLISSVDTVVSMGRVGDLDFHIHSFYIRLRYFVSAGVSNLISILVLLVSSGIKTCTAGAASESMDMLPIQH